jgi:hypothetical protein
MMRQHDETQRQGTTLITYTREALQNEYFTVRDPSQALRAVRTAPLLEKQFLN